MSPVFRGGGGDSGWKAIVCGGFAAFHAIMNFSLNRFRVPLLAPILDTCSEFDALASPPGSLPTPNAFFSRPLCWLPPVLLKISRTGSLGRGGNGGGDGDGGGGGVGGGEHAVGAFPSAADGGGGRRVYRSSLALFPPSGRA